MTPKEKEKNIRRINNLNWQLIKTFGFERMAIITSEYNESLVRKLIARGQSLKEQEIIYGHVRTTYEKWKKETALITGPVHFPAYFKDIITDLDCKIPIKGEEETDAPEESIEEYMAKHAMTKEDIDKAISDAENNTVPDEKSSETIAALEEHIKELEDEIEKKKSENKELKAENESLCKDIEELKEIKKIMDTPLDGIEAYSKVGLTEILKLMENDGANFEKSNNKTIAAKALMMMTGRSESACKQIFSSPLSPTYSGHKNKISELNGYLQALGMNTLL